MGYGQTGSGKSFTISGIRNNWEHRGLTPRLLSRMFAEKENRREVSKIEYRVSFVELYGKEAKDLLASGTNNKVRINEREPFKDVSVVCVNNEKEGLKRIFEGESRRSIAKESNYPASHLASIVITFHVSNTSLITSWGVVTTAKMHIVETAGTGTAGRTRWKTASNLGMANLTKTQLEQFFSSIGSSTSSAVSVIRSSNLLKILGGDFLVSSAVRFISHVRLTKEDLDVTLSTLRFTAKIARLKPVKMKRDIKFTSDTLVQRLQSEVNGLKKELLLNDMFLRQESLTNISRSRVEQINRSIVSFLNGKISDLTLFSASQAQVLLKCIKDLYNRLTAKECDVDKLKETYDNLMKTMSDGGALSSLPKKPVVLSIDDNQINNRKRLRSPAQSSLEAEEVKKGTGREVGSLDKSRVGVTLGPYVEEEVDSLRAPEQILKIDSQNMVPVRQMFERFLNEETVYAKIKEAYDKNEKTLAITRERFSSTIDKYYQAKRKLDDECDKLNKHRQIRQFLELKSEGNEVVLGMEKMIESDILCLEKILANLEQELEQAQNKINALSNQRLEMCSKLESGFYEYCEDKNFLLLHYTKRFMKILLESTKTESMDVIRDKYMKFQRAMLRKTEVGRPKKARLDCKGK
ncbi:kinesin-like protein KIF9 [Xylocopa sonorina]|uniref:kinesin-like protein KIF9 n=1 Tax=Xylocopa sonorina TaxID=1818115 RepID=UPI00403A9A7F